MNPSKLRGSWELPEARQYLFRWRGLGGLLFAVRALQIVKELD